MKINDEISIKKYWEKQRNIIKKYDIKTHADFVQFCEEMRRLKNYALLISIIKYLLEIGEELERMSANDRRVINQATDLDAMMRSWINSMPVLSFSLLLLIADVCFPEKTDNDLFIIGHKSILFFDF